MAGVSSKSMKAVGRNMARANAQDRSKSVRTNWDGGATAQKAGSAKGDVREAAHGNGVKVRGTGAAVRGVRARGTMG